MKYSNQNIIRVLIVEDELIQARIIKNLLVNCGYTVCGIMAKCDYSLKAIKALRPDIVLMDIVMPGEMDGIQAAIQIREVSFVPVLFVTALVREEDLERAKAAQPYGLLIKPVSERELKPAIEMALNLARTDEKRRQAESALKESEARLRALINAMPDIVRFKDDQGRLLEGNEHFLQNFDLADTQYTGKTDAEFSEVNPFHRETFRHCAESDELAWKNGVTTRTEEVMPTKDGGFRTYDVIKVPMFHDDGSRQGLVVVGRDITELKNAEKRLRASLAEKEVLLTELHHRVKNNMQIIISLLHLQTIDPPEKSFDQALAGFQRRISAMALVHEQAYFTESLAEIDLGQYVRDLCRSLASSLSSEIGRKIKVDIDIDPNITVEAVQAIPCGLAVNEMFVNAARHAFADGRSGIVRIKVGREADGLVKITCGDNGIGLPEGFDFRNSSTLGFKLLKGLAEDQLGGRLEMDQTEGTEFTLRFNTVRTQGLNA